MFCTPESANISGSISVKSLACDRVCKLRNPRVLRVTVSFFLTYGAIRRLWSSPLLKQELLKQKLNTLGL